MIMTPGIRRFALTTHVTFSVGWLGAVAGFLALAVAGLITSDNEIARAAYFAIELVGWFVIVPFCLGSLLSGLVQSAGTEWGFFRHYWIIAKLFLTVAATIILLVHMRLVSHVAHVALSTTFSISQLRGLRIQLVADACAALCVLLVATALSIYKPWGKTSHARGRTEFAPVGQMQSGSSRRVYFIVGLVCLGLIVVLLHIIGGGIPFHPR